jgi:hypothetical protein
MTRDPVDEHRAKVAEFEQVAIDHFYRVERQWRVLSFWTSLVGVVGFWVDYRASGALLMGLSTLCQLLSWRAMRGTQRLEKQRIERLQSWVEIERFTRRIEET